MKSSTLFLVLLLCCSVAGFKNFAACVGGSFALNGNDGAFGCISGSSWGTTTFTLTTTASVFVNFTAFAPPSRLLVTLPNNQQFIYSNSNSPSTLIIPTGQTTFQFSFSYWQEYPVYFSAVVTDAWQSIRPGQMVKANVSSPPSGFQYFVLPKLIKGRYFQVAMQVQEYDGLFPPQLFIQSNTLPSLNSYNYSNTANTTTPTISLYYPPDAMWVIGVYLSGNSATFTLNCTWDYSFTMLTNGQVVQSSTQLNAYSQLVVPPQTSLLDLKVARELPGGYVIVVVGEGFVPNNNTYSYRLDTSQQSYVHLTIKEPYNATNWYPGWYVFNFLSADGSNAGYMFKASWTASSPEKHKKQATIIDDTK